MHKPNKTPTTKELKNLSKSKDKTLDIEEKFYYNSRPIKEESNEIVAGRALKGK